MKNTPKGKYSEFGMKMSYIFNTIKEVNDAMLGLVGLPLYMQFWIRPFADIIVGVFNILLYVDGMALYDTSLTSLPV